MKGKKRVVCLNLAEENYLLVLLKIAAKWFTSSMAKCCSNGLSN